MKPLIQIRPEIDKEVIYEGDSVRVRIYIKNLSDKEITIERVKNAIPIDYFELIGEAPGYLESTGDLVFTGRPEAQLASGERRLIEFNLQAKKHGRIEYKPEVITNPPMKNDAEPIIINIRPIPVDFEIRILENKYVIEEGEELTIIFSLHNKYDERFIIRKIESAAPEYNFEITEKNSGLNIRYGDVRVEGEASILEPRGRKEYYIRLQATRYGEIEYYPQLRIEDPQGNTIPVKPRNAPIRIAIRKKREEARELKPGSGREYYIRPPATEYRGMEALREKYHPKEIKAQKTQKEEIIKQLEKLQKELLDFLEIEKNEI